MRDSKMYLGQKFKAGNTEARTDKEIDDLYNKAAKILKIDPMEVRKFCTGPHTENGRGLGINIITPQQLAKEYKEYIGESKINFRNKVKFYLNINEEMADKTSADLTMLIKKLKPVYKNGTVMKIQEYADQLKIKADELRTNNAYKNLVAQSDALRTEMLEFVKTK